ncbi:MAG: 30S ribosome-binding factor RbfA [Treponema sp.]|nr:30S ribosome-binding factor RbfA [Treponema sp.]
MGQYRMERLGNQLREEIASMLMKHEVKDPRVNEFLTINRVEVAKDLAYAKVYVSSFMDDASVERGVQGLQSAAGFIQSSIAKKVSIYRFPKLTFIADFSMKEGFEMVQKLNKIVSDDEAAANGSSVKNTENEETEN